MNSSLHSSPYATPVLALVASVCLAILTTMSAVAANFGPVIWGRQKFDIRDFDQSFTQIVARRDHNIALRNDGKVVVWGNNLSGQANVPSALGNAISVAAGQDHSLAVKSDGTVAAWGSNSYSQCNVPAGLTDVASVAAGAIHSMALKEDGTVVAWGYNANGESTVPAGLNGVIALAGGQYHSVALKSDGTVVAWGYNNAGQADVPVGLSGVTAIAAGYAHNVALKNDGTVVAWGYNNSGQANVPAGLSGVIAIGAGDFFSVALKSDGTVVAWGQNTEGQTNVPAGLTGVVGIGAGGDHAVARKSDGSVVAWGYNRYGQSMTAVTASGITSFRMSPDHVVGLKADGTVVAWGFNTSGQTVVPAGLNAVTAVAAGDAHSVVLKSDGTVVAWGYNGYGQTAVPAGLSGVTAISSGANHILALKNDGTVAAWGSNGSGETTVPAGLSGVAAISARYNHSLALKSDGTVVGWGYNGEGQVSIPAGLQDVVAICAGYLHGLALKSDGTVVAWGRNSEGQATVPAGLSDVVAIDAGYYHSIALKSDGSLVMWGQSNGGTVTVPPAGLSHIESISSGGYMAGVVIEQVSVVPGSANIWLAGQTNGTAATNDTTANAAPVELPLALTPGHDVIFDVSGGTHNGPMGPGTTGPDGGSAITHTAENGIATLAAPLNGLVGVFLDDTAPSGAAPSSYLDFTNATIRDQAAFAPGLRQPFFIGDGRTSGNVTQRFRIPTGATRLFVGSLDQFENNGNYGSFDVSASVVTPLAPEVEFTSFGDGSPLSLGQIVDFGPSSIPPRSGAAPYTYVTITNTGAGLLSGVDANLTGVHAADFVAASYDLPASRSLAPGQSASYLVYFTPTAVGSRSAALQFSCDDADEGNFYINLTGVGSDPATTERLSSLNLAPDGAITDLAAQPDGSVIAVGAFTTIGGQPRTRIARILPNGTVEDSPAWDTLSVNSTINAVVVLADGSILIGGYFTSVNGHIRNHIARLNTDGSLDESWYPSLDDGEVWDLALESGGGTVLVAGFFQHVNSGLDCRGLVRFYLSGNGALDGNFSPNPSGSMPGIYDVEIEPDGQILVGGTFSSIAGSLMDRMARLNANGTLDPAFPNPQFDGSVRAIKVQPDGKILAGGIFDNAKGAFHPKLVRFEDDGTLDSDFNGSASAASSGEVSAIALTANGMIVIGGNFTHVWAGYYGWQPWNDVARLYSNGYPDFAFQAATGVSDAGVRTVLGLGNDLWIGGSFATMAGQSCANLARIAGPTPEIHLVSTGAITHTDGDTRDFGSVLVGSGTLGTIFTIQNIGAVPLSGFGVVGGVTIDAVQPGDTPGAFNISYPGSNSLNPGATTTLTISFIPVGAGAHGATLRIHSNDSDEEPFDIRLTGTGVNPDPGTIALGAASFMFNEEAGTVTIPVTRTGGGFGAASVQFSTGSTGGSPATAGVDYTAIVNQVVNWGDGETGTKQVNLTLLPPGISETNETFGVTLSNATTATLGSPSTAVVTIIDSADTTAPGAPSITTPTANQVLTLPTGDTVNVTGTATDNKGVASVKVKLNNGSFVNATLTSPNTPNTPWNLTVTPANGRNTLTVQTTDTRGLTSTQVTRNFTVLRSLVVNADTTRGSVTAGFYPTSSREPGRSYTITATPKPPVANPFFAGAIFTGWTLGGQDVANGNAAFTPQRLGMAASSLEKQTITFLFREGLTLTANFAPNPFILMAGAYNGLIRPSATLPDRAPAGAGGGDGTTRTNATEGRFSATMQNTGAFSGTLTIDGTSLLVAGAFDHNGDARFGSARLPTLTVARAGKPSFIVSLELDMVTPGANDKITGAVTAIDYRQSVTTAVSTVDSDRAYYNGTTLIPDSYYLGAANANGSYTAILPAEDVNNQPAGLTVRDYPQGTGTAVVTITKAGAVTVIVSLADGAPPVTATSALSQADTFPLFAKLYNKLGFLSGMVALDKLDPDSDFAADDLMWLRPFQGTSHYYTFGWPEVIKVDLFGAKYAATAGQSSLRMPGGGALGPADADGNAALSFGDGQLSETLLKTASLSVADVVTKVPDNDPTFTLSITRTTGAFSGVFDHTNDTKPAFSGILYQKGTSAGGHGFFLTKQPIPIDYTGESGVVTLTGQP